MGLRSDTLTNRSAGSLLPQKKTTAPATTRLSLLQIMAGTNGITAVQIHAMSPYPGLPGDAASLPVRLPVTFRRWTPHRPFSGCLASPSQATGPALLLLRPLSHWLTQLLRQTDRDPPFFRAARALRSACITECS